MYRQIVLSKIKEYCEKSGYSFTKTGKVIMLNCPYCSGADKSANVIPNTSIIKCLKCSKSFTLFDLVREFEGTNDSDEKVADHLIEYLNIDLKTKKSQDDLSVIFERYAKEGFCLVPCAKNDKVPIQNNWTNIENRNPDEWHQWLNNSLNIGIRTGSASNLTVIDIDILSQDEKVDLVDKGTKEKKREEIKNKKVIPAEIKEIMGSPWIQDTLGGFHLFYKYVELPKSRIVREGYAIDVENNGGQVISVPSPAIAVKKVYTDDKGINRKRTVGYGERVFLEMGDLPEMPEALLNSLKKEIPKETKRESIDYKEEPAVKLEVLDEGDGRNNFFTSLGGGLLKKLTLDQVEYTLHMLNNRLCKTPLEGKEIKAMTRSLERYDDQYQNKLEQEIFDYVKLAEGASKPDIEIAVLGCKAKGEMRKKVDEILAKLIRERRVIRKGRFYQVINQMQWTDTFMDIGIPIDFQMPYFHEYANFNYGDLILIGATSKTGKTTLGMNIVKRLVEQNLKPYYIFSETGARFKNSACSLGLKDSDFYKCYCDNVDDVQFKKGRHVTVWDWIDPQDFAKTNVIFGDISRKLEESQGICIAFVQLRDGVNGGEPEWFAKNMIRQRPALAAKYLYESEDGSIGKFKLCEVRDAKTKGKTFDIPTRYNWDTKEVLTHEEFHADPLD